MDDFGIGYSSLNMLKDIPVNILKIDMHFVQDITSSDRAASVLSNVIRMAKWLEMQVVAEGVETTEQLTFLRSIGCDSVQGYYYSKPLPEAEFVQLLERYTLDGTQQNDENALNGADLDMFWNTQQGVTLLNAMIRPVGIYELGEDQLELLCVNDAYYEMTGITPSTLFSETLQATSWIYQEDRDMVIHACKQAVETRQIQCIKVRRYHNLGSILWVDMRIRYIGHRNTRNVFCFEMEDITEQENEQRINEIEPYIVEICHTYDVIYQLNYSEMTSTTMYYTNASILNIDQDELWKGLEVFFNQLHPDDRPMIQGTFALASLHNSFADGRKTFEREARILHNGQYWLFSMVIVCAAHTNGQEVYLACVKLMQRQSEIISDVQPLQTMSKQTEEQAAEQRLQVLVVDDNQLNRIMLRKMLTYEYDVLEAENGQQALQLLASNWQNIVAIMLDLVMPIMDGYAFLEARAVNDAFAAIPVIVLSHSDARDAELKALSLGANDFLKKPYEPVVIKQRLENFIRLREIAEHNRYSEETIRQLTQECASLKENNKILRKELQHAKTYLNLGGLPDGEC